MFLLLVLFTGLGQLHASFNSHKTFLQTTVPEKISSSVNKNKVEQNVAYIITIEGKKHLIYLKKQSFLSSGAVVSSYDKENTLLRSKPLSVQMDCNYQGYAAGFPNSMVTLSTCSGLRGILQFTNISYGIEPLEALSGFVHKIYEEKNDINIPLLGDSDIYSWSIDSQYQVKKSSKSTGVSKLWQRYLEMHIIVDKDLFDYMGSDIKVVTQKVILIIGLVNAMLTQLKLTVIISSIEIWSNKNQIPTTGHPDHVLHRLLEWERKYFDLQPHHSTFLFSFRKYPSFMGTTFPGKVCDMNYAKGVALYSEGLSLESFTVIIVQLLGLNMGLTYDTNTDKCLCAAEICTMMPKAVHFGGVKDFSTCSLDNFKYIIAHSNLNCLQNHSVETPVYKQPGKVCGNGKVEPGEECDCGTAKDCTHKSCCDPRTCMLKRKKVCGSGECCTKTCKIKPAGELCRERIDDQCDFPEYCNGSSSFCVEDTFARNGESCDSGDAWCFEGRCKSFDRQCQALIGGDSTGAPFDCYEEINSRGDRYGNCGPDVCAFPDLLCGKLICSWPHKRLVIRSNFSVLYTHLRDEMCVTTYRPFTPAAKLIGVSESTTYSGLADRDETFVHDGTPCGPGMYCFRFKCLETTFFHNSALCDPVRHCNSKGVCNNFNHCHCEENFAPPDCQVRKGEFGSIDDGHPIKPAKSLIQGRYASTQKNQLQLIGYICIPMAVIITVVLIKRNKLRELFYREDTDTERSLTEENSSSSKLSLSTSNNPSQL